MRKRHRDIILVILFFSSFLFVGTYIAISGGAFNQFNLLQMAGIEVIIVGTFLTGIMFHSVERRHTNNLIRQKR